MVNFSWQNNLLLFCKKHYPLDNAKKARQPLTACYVVVVVELDVEVVVVTLDPSIGLLSSPMSQTSTAEYLLFLMVSTR